MSKIDELEDYVFEHPGDVAAEKRLADAMLLDEDNNEEL